MGRGRGVARREGGAQQAGPHPLTRAHARAPTQRTQPPRRARRPPPLARPACEEADRPIRARQPRGSRRPRARAHAGGSEAGTALPHPAGRPRRSGSEREADRGARPGGQSRPCGRSARARLRSRPGARPRPGSEPRRRARAQGWRTPLDGQREGDRSRPARPPRPRRGTGTGAEGPGPGPTPRPRGKGERPARRRSTFTHIARTPAREGPPGRTRAHARAERGNATRGEDRPFPPPHDADDARDHTPRGRAAAGPGSEAHPVGGGPRADPMRKSGPGQDETPGEAGGQAGRGGAGGRLRRSRPPPGRTRGSHRQQPPSTKAAPRGTWSGRPGPSAIPAAPPPPRPVARGQSPRSPLPPTRTARPTQTLRAPTGPPPTWPRRRAPWGYADTGPTSVAGGGDAPRRRSRVRAQTGRPTA